MVHVYGKVYIQKDSKQLQNKKSRYSERSVLTSSAHGHTLKNLLYKIK